MWLQMAMCLQSPSHRQPARRATCSAAETDADGHGAAEPLNIAPPQAAEPLNTDGHAPPQAAEPLNIAPPPNRREALNTDGHAPPQAAAND